MASSSCTFSAPEGFAGLKHHQYICPDVIPPQAHLVGSIIGCISLLLLWPDRSMQDANLQEGSLQLPCSLLCGVSTPKPRSLGAVTRVCLEMQL